MSKIDLLNFQKKTWGKSYDLRLGKKIFRGD